MRKEIKGFPGYWISDRGEVWHYRFGKFNLLKDEILHQGHHRTVLFKKKRYRIMTHRLVLETFKSLAPKDKPFSRHLDGNPHNNDIKNLKWGTYLENKADSFKHGTVALGEQNGKSYLTTEIAKHIKTSFFKLKQRQCDIARSLELHPHIINDVVAGRSWRHVTI